jgi:enoyl-CoA hydratase/3-hydroxyacyl-CoA dehydrogenase
MEAEDVQNVTVLGAGSMGHGIAEVAAIAGYDVVLRDIEDDIVQDGYDEIEWSLEKLSDKGMIQEDADEVLSRVTPKVDLKEAVEDADFVVEAAPENLDIKHEIFSDVEEYAPDHTIMATNTSSLPISDIAEAVEEPERVVGTHFFNPPVKMDLVEVIYGDETSDETAETAYDLMEDWDKTAIYVRKDVRGFVVNTVMGPFMDEPAWMVDSGEATIRQADATMVYDKGYPMGPFELSDMTGIDIGYHVRKEAGNPVPALVEEKVENDELGKKTGKGYYEYEDGEGPDYTADDAGDFDTLRVEARMVNQAAYLVGEDVATPEDIDVGVELGGGFPEGICRRGDKIGLDNVLEKLQTLHEETGAQRYEPHEYLVELVEEDQTGEDAGQGFYSYDEEQEDDYHDLNYEITEDGVLEIELDRPTRLNALSQNLMEEIQDVLGKAESDEVLCVTFEGAGDRAFCAGADVTSFAGRDPIDVVGGEPVFETIYECSKPTIAKIEGHCLGGGFEVALACDMRIATKDSEFGFPEIDLGLIPGGGGTQRIMRLVGETRAKELVFRGNRIDAETAHDWGILNRAVEKDEFEEVVDEYVDDIVTGPPLALKVAKMSMNEGRDADIRTALAIENEGFGLLTTTDDMMEGASAFMEDREPEFEGE